MSKLKFENVIKKYGNNVVFENLGFEIDSGEFVVLVGPSGCGKTTLLRMISGLEDYDSGNVYYENKLANKNELINKSAMVFQNYALFPNMTVFDNMAFGLRNNKINKQEINDMIYKTAEMLKINHLLKRRPNELSGGEKQRVGLGRALVRKPDIFLLDEPLANLDAMLKGNMRKEIKKLHKRIKSTFVYVTHDQLEAMTLATKIIVIDDKSIKQIGTPYEIYKEPKNIFVATFFGSPKINILDAYIIKKDNTYYIKYDEQLFKLNKNKYNYEVLAKYDAKKIKIGIRAENIKITRNTGMQVDVINIENIGKESYLYVKYKNDYLNVISTADYDVKKEIFIDFNDDFLLFDYDSEKNICSK